MRNNTVNAAHFEREHPRDAATGKFVRKPAASAADVPRVSGSGSSPIHDELPKVTWLVRVTRSVRTPEGASENTAPVPKGNYYTTHEKHEIYPSVDDIPTAVDYAAEQANERGLRLNRSQRAAAIDSYFSCLVSTRKWDGGDTRLEVWRTSAPAGVCVSRITGGSSSGEWKPKQFTRAKLRVLWKEDDTGRKVVPHTNGRLKLYRMTTANWGRSKDSYSPAFERLMGLIDDVRSGVLPHHLLEQASKPILNKHYDNFIPSVEDMDAMFDYIMLPAASKNTHFDVRKLVRNRTSLWENYRPTSERLLKGIKLNSGDSDPEYILRLYRRRLGSASIDVERELFDRVMMLSDSVAADLINCAQSDPIFPQTKTDAMGRLLDASENHPELFTWYGNISSDCLKDKAAFCVLEAYMKNDRKCKFYHFQQTSKLNEGYINSVSDHRRYCAEGVSLVSGDGHAAERAMRMLCAAPGSGMSDAHLKEKLDNLTEMAKYLISFGSRKKYDGLLYGSPSTIGERETALKQRLRMVLIESSPKIPGWAGDAHDDLHKVMTALREASVTPDTRGPFRRVGEGR